MLDDFGQFVNDDHGNLVWEEARRFPLSDTGCLYVARKTGDGAHELYKLQQNCAENKGKRRPKTYSWYALWNTCAIAGVRQGHLQYQHEFASMEEAIRAMLGAGWKVQRIHLSDLPALLANYGKDLISQ